ncbi:bifunctional GNAT family N-acetyltransferase/(deoxy)nucleoside triphosphate pyrophosphohydrolase [Swaminathania salitolerans]|uniref:8-oxo-dGTP diphosphatase n=1 Tax=Swaminathania salitolerans TaxID=182838 RepID=A0A511BM46_9PROT|nr:bifunctional GNAT family N-acetyltransferase/(deoxy)nucleoside triphosphate pyrophosphohydrolase [Swaminathania salitolerans]GBQ15571.1 acetyltransferase [Swaminathania salitolerans LMG 21291]GEL01407.1 hypothetical protein SSA02_05700 [Swaminathania salitolerans]
MTASIEIAPYRLRPLRLSDGADIHRLVNDWSVVRMLSHLPFPYPRELADRWIGSTIQRQSAGQAWHFGICDDKALIGCIGVSLDAPGRAARIGYWLGRAHWGRGIATLCVTRIVAWAFETLPASQILADVAQDNPASIALLRRLGFSEAGRTTIAFLSRGGEPCPVLTMSLARSGFSSVAARLGTVSAETSADHDPGMTPRPTGPATATAMPAASGAGTVPDGIATKRPASAAPRILLVVAAVLVDRENRVLIARRPPGKPLAGLWEFPGGKVEHNESPEQALIRELHEELGVDLSAGCIAPLTFVSENSGGRHLLMPLFICRRWRHDPVGREGQELAWVSPEALHAYPMPNPDRPLIPLLQELLSG